VPDEQPQAAPDKAHDLDGMVSLWPGVIELVRGENARLGAAIERSRPVAVRGEELTVAFGSSFLKKQAEGPADRMTLAEALKALTGVRWRVSYELREELAESLVDDSEPGGEERWLARFMEEFDAEELPPDDAAGASGGEDAPNLTSNQTGA
jgi:hypothetical protein